MVKLLLLHTQALCQNEILIGTNKSCTNQMTFGLVKCHSVAIISYQQEVTATMLI